MKDLNHQLMKLCRQSRDGSFSTQATRSRILDLAANQLHELVVQAFLCLSQKEGYFRSFQNWPWRPTGGHRQDLKENCGEPDRGSGLKGLVSHDRYRFLESDFVILADAKWSSKLTDEDRRTMKDLNHQLMKLCRQNRDGSFSTQATRSRILDLAANQLHELGFQHMRPTSLKPKHVNALIAHWREQGISTGTLKNRLSAIRWWARKVNRESIMPRDNTAYGIGKRTCVAKESRAQKLDDKKLSGISDQHVRLSIRLQAAFGLRREESIKFNPSYAMQGDHIKLKSSWTKGGRARTVPITNEDQRQLLEEVKALARGGALIPPHLNYVQQLHRYERQLRNAGMSKLHGLRHAYAQRRYFELTGWQAPVADGPTSKQLTPGQVMLDYDARVIVSHELGHARAEIAVVYLGR